MDLEEDCLGSEPRQRDVGPNYNISLRVESRQLRQNLTVTQIGQNDRRAAVLGGIVVERVCAPESMRSDHHAAQRRDEHPCHPTSHDIAPSSEQSLHGDATDSGKTSTRN